MFVVWFPHVKCKSIINPKSWRHLHILYSNFVGSVCAFVENIYLDFVLFKDNLLILSQSLISDTQWTKKKLLDSEKSFIHIKNSSGPKMEPCAVDPQLQFVMF